MSTTVLESSLKLAKQGVRFFPCAENSKVPAKGMTEFSKKATSDEVELELFFGTGHHNSGIACGKNPNGKFLVAVDVDKKDGRDGFKTLEELEMIGYDLPKTWAQKTPSEGVHFLFWSPVPIKQGTNVLGPGVDLRGEGGYIVGPGSKWNGKPYNEFYDGPILDIPGWMIEKYAKRRSESIKKIANSDTKVDQLSAYKLTIDLLKSKPPVEGIGSRNNALSALVRQIYDIGLDAGQIPDLIEEHWKCLPPLDRSEIETTVVSSYKSCKDVIGNNHPANVFDIFPVETKDEKDFIDEMNEEYFYCTSEGLIYQELPYEDESLIALSAEIFHRNLLPSTLNKTVKDAPKRFQKSELWIENARRRQFTFVRFIPRPDVATHIYNLWKGFRSLTASSQTNYSPEAREGVNNFIAHCRENICDHDQKAFEWLMNFVAHMFQKPWEKPPVALVFHGEKGVGKNVFIDVLKFMIGRHATTISDRGILTARFNAIMEDKILIAFDEAFWSGDKSTEGKLKSIITDPRRNIERKGKEHYEAQVYDRIVIMGNEDRLVNATSDERRYAAFNVASHKQGNAAFFSSIMDGIREHSGDELLMEYFINRDISDFNIRKAPDTEGLREQKEHSLSNFEIWWRECLREGRVIGDYSGSADWPPHIKASSLFECYDHFLKDTDQREYKMSALSMGKKFRKIAPSCAQARTTRAGNSVSWNYVFCSLDQARKEWNNAQKLNEVW